MIELVLAKCSKKYIHTFQRTSYRKEEYNRDLLSRKASILKRKVRMKPYTTHESSASKKIEKISCQTLESISPKKTV